MRLSAMRSVIPHSVWVSALGGVLLIFLMFGAVVPTSGVKCIVCGLYNDGVGSITPCLNYTIDAHLKECPSSTRQCIKYVTGGSVVRECAPGQCQEKRADSWATSIYCCEEDGCNSATSFIPAITVICLTTLMCHLLTY